MAAAEHPLAQPASVPVSTGSYVQALISRHAARLQALRDRGFSGDDPEPLHQWRVSCRRLASVVEQFAPVLRLPRRLQRQRIAALARSAGQCRDLDVQLAWLQGEILPALPSAEQQALSPSLERLERWRAEALLEAQALLAGRRCDRLLQRLRQWQRRPRFQRLAQEPLQAWLPEWLAPVWSDLFTLPGWWAGAEAAAEQHRLRRRIKRSRYSLEALEPVLLPQQTAWLAPLRQAQDSLGAIQDLQVLAQLLADPRLPGRPAALPQLRALLEQRQRQAQQQWQTQAQWWRSSTTRHGLLRDLQAAGLQETEPWP